MVLFGHEAGFAALSRDGVDPAVLEVLSADDGIVSGLDARGLFIADRINGQVTDRFPVGRPYEVRCTRGGIGELLNARVREIAEVDLRTPAAT